MRSEWLPEFAHCAAMDWEPRRAQLGSTSDTGQGLALTQGSASSAPAPGRLSDSVTPPGETSARQWGSGRRRLLGITISFKNKRLFYFFFQ